MAVIRIPHACILDRDEYGFEEDIDPQHQNDESKIHRQANLFMRAVQSGAFTDGCSIEYSEYKRDDILVLRLVIKSPETHSQLDISPRLMRE